MTRSQLQVFDDALALSRAAAEHIASLVTVPRLKGEVFTIALCGGSTPQRLYRLLAQMPYALTIPWPSLHIFWGDERCVPPDDPESNYHLARELWLQHVPLPPENVHRIKGELGPVAAAEDYAQQLRATAALTAGGTDQAWPRLDLALLGLGEDGHVASLFPGAIDPAETLRPTLAVTAQYQGRPAGRVTLTPAIFNTARQVLFLVTGANKREALARSRDDTSDAARWPACRLQPENGLVVWMADRAAADGAG